MACNCPLDLAMTALNLTNQLLNFIAPAAFLALALVLLTAIFTRLFTSKRPFAHSRSKQFAIIFIVSALLLLVGLVVFGRDGRVASYALLAVGAATCQWVLLRGWKG